MLIWTFRYVLPKSEVPSRGIFSVDDDAAEGRGNEQPGASNDRRANGRGQQGKDKRKQRGQNTNRTYGELGDYIKLCNSRAFYNEFSPRECKFGDRCKLCHDLRKYLEEGKRRDLDVFGGKCIVFETYGRCPSGWKCRFVGSHSKEVELEDGNTELVLMGSTLPLHEGMAVNLPLKGLQKQQEHAALAETTGSDEAVGKPDDVPVKDDGLEQPNADLASHVDDATEKPEGAAEADESKPAEHKEGTKNENSLEKAEEEDARPGIVNKVSTEIKFSISRKKIDMTRADEYINWLHLEGRLGDDQEKRRLRQQTGDLEEMRAQYKEPPFKPSEKRKIYFGPETPVLAPLTTQGNIPFRRLCVELGAQATYSEMAMGQGLLQGTKVDWTLLRAHETEISPPKINFDTANIVQGYDHARDLKYGVQISANQPWIATKTADILNRFVPHVRVIDLNCGCPIDMVYKSGGGSGLLDHPAKLERMVRGMNALSGEIPITVKLRTGVRTNRPTASTTIGRLAFGGRDVRDRLGAPGCAAITLHGRSREARYTKTANWEYIAECANMIRTYNSQKAYLTDTVAEPDESTLANSKDGRMFFLGNGDCFSHVEYYNHTEKAKVDSVMIGRGALVKPWLFEEIEKGQYLDKSSSERLAYIEKFVRYGLEAWGSDELGIGYTRRFLLEWMSFACRYVPIGILEHLPPALNARPPPFRGRDELETLMASDNYRDWIKIRQVPTFTFQTPVCGFLLTFFPRSEMFLGPTQEGFRFQPKHKSNSYDTEG